MENESVVGGDRGTLLVGIVLGKFAELAVESGTFS